MTDDSKAEWRPIEAAPKDGTEILLWSSVDERSTGGPTIGRWATNIERQIYVGDCGGECHCPEYDFDEDITWLSWDGGFTKEHPSTHWMPLPEPPKEG